MSNQFTPGPWRVRDNQIESLAVPPDEYGNYPTVIDLHGAMGGEDANADARLIVAAPALYEALEWIANVSNQCANGGLKRPGKADSMAAHKGSERQIRDRARAALALVEVAQ